MLPAVLSANVCSLLEGVDRYACSVIWTFDRALLDDPGALSSCRDPASLGTLWFGRTVIRSRHKLSYQQAQDIFESKPAEKTGVAPAQASELRRQAPSEGLVGVQGWSGSSLRNFNSIQNHFPGRCPQVPRHPVCPGRAAQGVEVEQRCPGAGIRRIPLRDRRGGTRVGQDQGNDPDDGGCCRDDDPGECGCRSEGLPGVSRVRAASPARAAATGVPG